MKKKCVLFLLGSLLAAHSAFAQSPNFSFPPSFPYPDVVGTASTTAIAKDDAALVAWATGVDNYTAGTNVGTTWQDTAQGLGPADGTSFGIVCLGRGGQITLTFQFPIFDGAGNDFAVFENSFSNVFLEIAWVEVSSDGVHFVRFPNFSQTDSAVGGFGEVAAKKIHGFAGKYQRGYGTPFDLAEIKAAHAAALQNPLLFPSSYSVDLLANYSEVDFDDIRYVRLIDIVGDGSQQSALRNSAAGDAGSPIYDPYPTVGSAGFDLDAVGVLNQVSVLGLEQHLFIVPPSNQLIGATNVLFQVVSSSGLPVSLFVDDGPNDAIVSELTHRFSSGSTAGSVRLRASQAGGVSNGLNYAPAEDVRVEFEIVAARAPNAPRSFADWQNGNGLTGSETADQDRDGASDFEEYAAGTDPNRAASVANYGFEAAEGGDHYVLTLVIDRRAQIQFEVETSTDLSIPAPWESVTPELISISEYLDGNGTGQVLRLRVPTEKSAKRFWRYNLRAR